MNRYDAVSLVLETLPLPKKGTETHFEVFCNSIDGIPQEFEAYVVLVSEISADLIRNSLFFLHGQPKRFSNPRQEDFKFGFRIECSQDEIQKIRSHGIRCFITDVPNSVGNLRQGVRFSRVGFSLCTAG